MVAAIFGAPPPVEGRKKMVTYGRQSRLPKQPKQKTLTVERPQTSLVRHNTLHKTPKPSSLADPRSTNKHEQLDDFDVPSSDSDHTPVKQPVAVSRKVRNEANTLPTGVREQEPAKGMADIAKQKDTRYLRTRAASKEPQIRQAKSTATVEQASEEQPSKKRKRAGSHGSQTKEVAPKTYVRTNGSASSERPRAFAVNTAASTSQKPSSTRRSLQEGVSAPARLAHMVDETILEEDTLVESPQIPVRRRPQPNNTQTPPRSQARPPLLKASSSITPKQTKLWDQLLEPGPTDVGTTAAALQHAEDKARSRSDSKDPKDKKSTHPQLHSPPLKSKGMRLADRLKQDSQVEDDEEMSSSEEEDLEAEVPVAVNASQGGPANSQGTAGQRTTYAQTRSYLQEVSLEDSLLIPLADLPPRPTKNAPARDEMDLESDDEPSQGIRSIHELRAAGTKKRFLDDVEILLDDVKDTSRSGWSKRRSALMDLSSKLEDLDFATRFADHGFISTVVQTCGPSKPADVVSDSILLVILARLADLDLPRHTVEELTSSTNWLSESGSISNRRSITSIAKDRESNMARMSRDSYIDFMGSLSESSFWRSSKPKTITMDVLALRALEAIVLKARKNGQRQSLLPSASKLQAVVAHVSEKIDDPDQLLKRSLALSTLEAESISITVYSVSAAKSWTSSILKVLIGFFGRLLAPQASDLTLTLRLLLNLTNNQPANCSLFATTDCGSNRLLQHIGSVFTLQSSLASVDNATLDGLLLSLGLAINLAEHSDTVRRASLPGKESDPLGPLVQSFLKGREASSQADSMEESRGNVAYGYLAVLLGNLCLNNKAKAVISKQMGGLEGLIGAVEEFLGYHRRIDEGQEGWEGFTDRLGAVLTKLRV
ncbi:hypothetical protein BDZ85DRAFT_270706 [Elsinoe ampelina]|uniref:Wings apart-like protein C-terminal domain-containing protein n=1 Tax=Elsinoe ampelina TaxID=302913 RepID=A0A6A6FXY6_9PEZI|nr:hypothetical protein BDZ85DRAFT_270706 [Elsinoe ampelina]